MCVLCVAKYGRNRLDLALHLMKSISVGNARSCSTYIPCGFSRTGGSGRFEYDGPDIFKVNRHGLDVVHQIYVDPSDPAHECVNNVVPLRIQQMILRSPLKR